MLDTDLETILEAIGWLEAGRLVALGTVAHTFGSSPRPLGSQIALSDDGRVVGSVSGGCVEADLIEQMRSGQLIADRPKVLTYGISKEDAARYGLPCGGRLELVVEQLFSPDSLRPVAQTIGNRRLIKRVLCLQSGQASLHEASSSEDFAYDGKRLAKVYGPKWRLLIIGAGQLSHYLTRMALALGYDTVVCEPRSEYAQSWQIQGASLTKKMPDDVVRELIRDARCAVITTTHDPRLDDLALLEALESPAFYVGALGSRRTSGERRARLISMGIAKERVRRLHAPVGLSIGSRTPPEIAIAVLAHMIAVQKGVQPRLCWNRS
jgi:xanthine dehydrogenase accessory factor